MSCEPIPLTNIGVIPNVEKEPELQTWGSWEDPLSIVTAKPVDPVQQQIEMYRQQRIAASSAVNEEPGVDYFQDMTPNIVKQTKLVLQSKEADMFQNSMNLSLAPDPIFSSSELQIWEDNQSWEDQTQQDWDANALIREKKRMEREKRLDEQQRKRMERERSGRSMLAVKLS